MTFWDTKLFKNQDGEETPFGLELKWQVIRQMDTSDAMLVDDQIDYAHIALTVFGCFVLILVLSYGPLLPVWMFINSMQLIAHVPLIRTNLPGSSHFFLLDYLNIIRMQVFSLNSWLK